MILGLDLDGVVADYHKALKQAVADHNGVSAEDLAEDVSWDLGEWGITKDEYLEIHKDLVSNGAFFNLEPLEGAVDAITKIAARGIRIRIITHRFVTPGDHAIAASDTVAWLDARRVPYNDICFIGAKGDVDADLYVDDAPHHVEALQKAGKEVLVFDQPWNRSTAGRRVSGWGEAERAIMARASQIAADNVSNKQVRFPFEADIPPEAAADLHRSVWSLQKEIAGAKDAGIAGSDLKACSVMMRKAADLADRLARQPQTT